MGVCECGEARTPNQWLKSPPTSFRLFTFAMFHWTVIKSILPGTQRVYSGDTGAEDRALIEIKISSTARTICRVTGVSFKESTCRSWFSPEFDVVFIMKSQMETHCKTRWTSVEVLSHVKS